MERRDFLIQCSTILTAVSGTGAFSWSETAGSSLPADSCLLMTELRDGQAAEEELHLYLRMSNRSSVDCWINQDIRTEAEWERFLSPEGFLAAAREAQRAGKVRFVGVSLYRNPEQRNHSLRS